MLDIINLLNTNKEWLFSGTGTEVIAVIISVIGGIIIWLLKKNNTEQNQTQINQTQIVKNNSSGNQAGHDITTVNKFYNDQKETINESDIGDKECLTEIIKDK